MKKHDFAVFGNCATVQMLKFKDMPHIGQTETALNPFADELFYGGCAFNVFYCLTRLGVDSLPVLTYADIRFKDKLYEICDEYGLDTSAIEGPPTRSYSTCLMLEDGQQNHITIMYHFGEDSDQGTVEFKPHTIKPEYFQNAKIALMVMGTPATGYKICEEVRKSGIPLAFSYRNDPRLLPKELLAEILPLSEVVFTNEVEAEYLTGLFELKDMTDWFEKGRAKVVVTTLGGRGSRVYHKEEDGSVSFIEVPITKTEAGCLSAVGAGDAFVAGFMYGYVNGKSLELCAQLGSTLSSFVIEKEGSTTNLPTLEQLLARNATRPDARED